MGRRGGAGIAVPATALELTEISVNNVRPSEVIFLEHIKPVR